MSGYTAEVKEYKLFGITIFKIIEYTKYIQ